MTDMCDLSQRRRNASLLAKRPNGHLVAFTSGEEVNMKSARTMQPDHEPGRWGAPQNLVLEGGGSYRAIINHPGTSVLQMRTSLGPADFFYLRKKIWDTSRCGREGRSHAARWCASAGRRRHNPRVDCRGSTGQLSDCYARKVRRTEGRVGRGTSCFRPVELISGMQRAVVLRCERRHRRTGRSTR